MKYTRVLLAGLLACICAASAAAGPIAVTASAAFTGFDRTWSFSYDSGAPGLLLQQITIDLTPTGLAFDTASGGFGSLGFLDVGNYGGTDVSTGLSGISATGTGLDGGSIVTFTFADFNVGEGFQFSADLDHPDPALLTLVVCSGTPLQKALCNAGNAVRTATNDARLLAADTVLSAQAANAIVIFQFGGSGFETGTVTSSLQAASLQAIINGLLNGDPGALASTSNPTDEVPVPEPSTVAVPLIGLAGFLLTRRRTS